MNTEHYALTQAAISIMERSILQIQDVELKLFVQQRVSYFELRCSTKNDGEYDGLTASEATELFQIVSRHYDAMERHIGSSDDPRSLFFIATVGQLRDKLEGLAHETV